MAIEMWPHCIYDEELKDFTRIISSPTEVTFLALQDENHIGFATLSLRNDFVEGATSYPVGYLEGIYVRSEYRKTGVGKILAEKGEAWAREKGCKDFCSDAEIENQTSIDFHKRLGFREANRVVCFHKTLD